MNLFEAASTRPVTVVPMPPAAEFRTRFLHSRTAAIFDNVAARLPAAASWSFEHFASRLQQIRIQRPAADGLYHYLGFDRVPFEEFQRLLEGANRAYAFEPLIEPARLRGLDPQQAVEELAGKLPDFVSPKTLYSSNLWIGSGGNKSLLHYDHVNSLLVMIEGTKRFLLFGPDCTPRMYPYPVTDLRSIAQGRVLDSRVNADQLDFERFPAIRGVKGFTGELKPGQALFIPAGTWHYIESQGRNVAVNYFWHDTPARFWLQRPLVDYLLKRGVVRAMDGLRGLRKALGRAAPSAPA